MKNCLAFWVKADLPVCLLTMRERMILVYYKSLNLRNSEISLKIKLSEKLGFFFLSSSNL